MIFYGDNWADWADKLRGKIRCRLDYSIFIVYLSYIYGMLQIGNRKHGIRRGGCLWMIATSESRGSRRCAF